MAAEQVAESVAFEQTRDHAVEAVLQPPDLGLLVDVDGAADVAALDLGHRGDDVVERIGDRARHQDQRPDSEPHRHRRQHDDGNDQ